MNLYFQPFGNFPLDTSKLFKSNDIKVTWSVDFTTATSHMQVFAKGDHGEADTLLAERTSDYGVAVPISALVTDWKTAATTSILSYVGTKAEAITSSGHWDSLKAGFNGVVN